MWGFAVHSADINIVVYDSRINSWFEPGGMAFNWTRERTIEASGRAKLLAPKRTGRLAASIRADTRPLAGNHVIGRLRSQAPYSLFVHEGTTGPIYATNAFAPNFTPGRFLKVPPWYGAPHKVIWADRSTKPWTPVPVRGQSGQPFLSDAVEQILVEHGVL